VSEVVGLLSFLQNKGKGQKLPGPSLAVIGTVPLQLSAETIGWVQQDSADDATQEQQFSPSNNEDLRDSVEDGSITLSESSTLNDFPMQA